MKNHYETLNVEPDIPYGEEGKTIIKKAFRKLAHQYHPDKSENNSSEKFNEINEAYEILYDDIKRRDYDFQTGFNPNTPKINRTQNSFFNPFGFKTSSFFVRRVEVPITLNLEDIFYGTTINESITFQGKAYSFDIKIEPKQIMSHSETINDNNGGTTIISFTPQIKKKNEKEICRNADKIIIDGNLNVNLIFKIPFEMALSGGNHQTNFLNEKVNSVVPKCCNHGYTINQPNLNLINGSKTNLIYYYELPNIDDEKVEKIINILNE